MGITLEKQRLDKMKSSRVDLSELQAMVKKIKTNEDIQEAIKHYLSIMTVEEKVGQLFQISCGDDVLPETVIQTIKEGRVGSFLNVWKLQNANLIQKISMEQSRLKIPQLMGKDVIHGYRTVFPIPLAQAASFNTEAVQNGSRVAAIECSAMGVKWTFSPMVDIARDPRWGRIAQGYGQDPYLASVMGAAAVKGYQTKNLSGQTSVAACGKHYVGYGATEGGRDYNTAMIPEGYLRDVYLPPFKALKDADCLTYMTAFTDLNGVVGCANEFTLKQVLRDEWKFTGLVVSDYNAVWEQINHGSAANESEAAMRAFNGGLDMQMVSTCFQNLEDLLAKNLCSLKDLDSKVGNILRVKFRMNLFENYYTDPSRQTVILAPKHKEAAKDMASLCPVLLQNKNKSLPIGSSLSTLAVIGALGDDPDNQIGTWAPDGKASDSITPLTSLKESLKNTKITFAAGYKSASDNDTSLIEEAVKVAASSEKVLIFAGESNNMSGEAASRANINLPGIQEGLIKEVAKTGRPIILVVYAGRPITLESVLPYVDSVLFAWHLGTMAGPALADLIIGNTSPSGKLPVSFPRAVGQIPIYYNKKNTGRPNNTHNYIPFTSCYIDIDPQPLFPFGFGLSYSTFSYSNFKMSRTSIKFGQSLLVSATVQNTGAFKADQIVMLFVRDLVGSFTRPVKELKDFARVSLNAGQSTNVTFVLSSQKLQFWTMDKEFKAEAGKFNVWIGPNSEQGQMGTFELTESKATVEEFQCLQ